MKKQHSPAIERLKNEISNPFVADEIANILEDVAWHGWNPKIFPHMGGNLKTLQQDAETSTLRLLLDIGPDQADIAGQWLIEKMNTPGGHAEIKRLSDAVRTGSIRMREQMNIVFVAVADFVRCNHAWPNRSDVAPDVSPRTRDAVFKEICDAFGEEIDGRVRWVDGS